VLIDPLRDTEQPRVPQWQVTETTYISCYCTARTSVLISEVCSRATYWC